MKNEVLRQKRISQQLADLPFASRVPRVKHEQQIGGKNINNDSIRRKNESKNKLKNDFYEDNSSERYYYYGPPFSLYSEKYEDDYDTIEAHARFCKAKIPGQDIEESEKMIFFSKLKSNNYFNHYKERFNQENSYDLNHDSLILDDSKLLKTTKVSRNFKKRDGSYPSFCRPYSERIKKLTEKESSNQEFQTQMNSTYDFVNQDSINFYSNNEHELRANKNSFKINCVNDEKAKKNITNYKSDLTPNIHVTRRVRSYYIANNMELPDFLERIDPIPLRYDRVVHYHINPI